MANRYTYSNTKMEKDVNFWACGWGFEKEKTGHLTHSLHPYTAKFVPQLPNVLISFFTEEGDVVFDPFCGCGTTLVEAKVLNRKSIGTDSSPLACLIAKVKVTELSDDKLDYCLKILKRVREETQQAYESPESKEIILSKHHAPQFHNRDAWFDYEAILELSILRENIDKIEDDSVKNFMYVVLSSIVTIVSKQDSETRYCINKIKKNSKFEIIQEFEKKLVKGSASIRELRSIKYPMNCKVYEDDSRRLRKVESNSVDFIVTSPPYLNAWDYNLYHRFRFFWLGFDVSTYKENEIGAHLAHTYDSESPKIFFNDMEQSLRQFFRVIKDEHYCCIVIGNSLVKGVHINSASEIERLGEKVGFTHILTILRPIPANRKQMNSTVGRIKEESIIIFQKTKKNAIKSKGLCAFTFQDYVKHGSERDLALLQLQSFFKITPSLDAEKKELFHATVNNNGIKQLRKLAFFKRVQILDSKGITTLIPDQVFFEYSGFLSKFVEDDIKLKYYLNKIADNHFGSKQSKYLFHSFHEYIGRFYPQIIRSLAFAYNPNGGTVLDPFNGSGTTAIESVLMSFSSVGVENNPLQVFLTKTKIQSMCIPHAEIDKCLLRLEKTFRDKKTDTSLDSFSYGFRHWFNDQNLKQLLTIRNEIDKLSSERDRAFFQLVLSSITKEASKWVLGQARVRMRKEPHTKSDIFGLFLERAKEYRNSVKLFELINRYLNIGLGTAKMVEGNSQDLHFLNSGSIRLIITSPPYANALPYMETDKLPAELLGFFEKRGYTTYLENEIGNREIGSKERERLEREFLENYETCNLPSNCKTLIKRLLSENSSLPKHNFRRKDHAAVLYKYYTGLRKVLTEAHRVLSSGGFCIIVIGNNKLRAGESWLEIKSDEYVTEMSKEIGFSVERIIKKELTHTSNFFSKIKGESILVLKRV